MVPKYFFRKCLASFETSVHGDSMEDVSQHQWRRFLLDNPFREDQIQSSRKLKLGLYHCHYRLDGTLIAVGVLDFLPECISSVYLYYDTKYTFLNLGTYSALMECFLTKSFHIPWYYMGYYVHRYSCQKCYTFKLNSSQLTLIAHFLYPKIACNKSRSCNI